MTAQLEAGYRRLLTAFPVRHRRMYGEEMLGVLLADAGPDQRRPGLRDTADLLRSALVVRLRGTTGALADESWRRAAYIVQVFGVVFLFAIAVRRCLLWGAHELIGGPYQQQLPLMDLARLSFWALVMAATLLRVRRPAAVLAVLAAGAEIVRAAGWYADSPSAVLRNCWLLMAAVVVAGAAVRMACGRWEPLPPRIWAAPVVGALLVAGSVAQTVQGMWWMSSTEPRVPRLGDWMMGIGTPMYVVAAVLAVPVAVRLAAPVRRRVVVFAVPVVTTALLVVNGFAGFMYSSQSRPNPVMLVPAQWVILVGVPLLAFGLAVVLLHRAERWMRLIELGRQADRQLAERQSADRRVVDGS
jgi:hypothetical protein